MNEKPKVEFLTGPAGTGKTYELKQRIHSHNPTTRRNYGVLCATTGIAAVNLSGANGDSVTTINSLLKYFDTKSMEESYADGKLQKALLKVAAMGSHLCIDEVSMMEGKQLDLLYIALEDVNRLQTVQAAGGLGLVLSGDFCQLPPIQGKYAFEGTYWEHFAANTTRLTKVWRQDNLEFLAAVNAARSGDGTTTAQLLSDLETEDEEIFFDSLDTEFDGTTILPLNKDVDRFNTTVLLKLFDHGKRKVTYKSFRWGVQRGEWKIIPDELTLAIDAYVMILSNDSPNFTFANGDCGYLKDVSEGSSRSYIKLKRNGAEVVISNVTRKVQQKETPDGMKLPIETWMSYTDFRDSSMGFTESDIFFTKEDVKERYKRYLQDLTLKYKVPNKPYYDFVDNRWIMGEITYMPLRLAYAATVHKTQGLTLDAIQIDPHNKFFGQGSMMYVALSRVRSHKGLRIVGSPKLVEERTNVIGEVLRWI